jgi:hypothetical protein
MNNDLYRVEKYTDQQLYDILDINNPTDGELEAKILQLIRKYKNLQNDSGDKLALFFENVYNHFFVAETEPMQEGFDPTPATGFIDVSNNLAVAANPQNIASVKTFEYSKDNLQINPLIKETISRVISVDSSYRDRKTYPYSTDFTFDLSEPLKDVVSLKLYSVQIPYTWYTVNKSYGSNFFFISSIHSDKSYKIQIDPGEYTKSTLIGAINTAFTDISNGEASDINFNGETFVEEIGVQTKAKINLNIQNTFNDTYYSLGFPYVISSYLGFTNTTYSLNSIVSAKQDLSGIQNEAQENYVIDASNNYFTVIQYIPNDSTAEYSGQKQILKEIKVYIRPDRLNQSRRGIYTLVNEAIQKEPLFDNSYTKLEELKDISNNTYFRFTVVLDRKKVKYVPNSKIALIFPDEGLKNHNGQSFSIWNNNINAAYNCFKFENSYNILSKLKAETQYNVSDVTLDLSQNITFKCNTPGYEGVNDFSFNITPFGKYNLPQFLTNINTTIDNYSSANDFIFNMNNTNISFDSENKVNFNIDMTKTFGNPNYRIIIDASSVLQSDKNQSNYTSTFDTSGNAGNDISGKIENITGGYSTSKTHLLRIVPSGTGGNKNAAPIDIELQPKNGARTYTSIIEFVEYLNLSVLNKTVSVGNIGDVQKPFRGPPTLNSPQQQQQQPFTYKEPKQSDTIIDISLNLHCIYQLFESHYSVYFNAYDISFSTSPWGLLQIDPSYNLFNKKNTAGTFSIIIGKEKTNSNRIDITSQNNILVLNTTNPVAPQDTIYLTLKPNIYTIDTLYKEINDVFSITPKTYGSFITSTNAYSEISLNINNVYTTADYKLVFYNPFSFMSCAFRGTIQKTTWDTTVGWMLGFRDYTEYGLTSENIVRDLNDSTKTYYLKSTSGGYTYSSTSYPKNQTPISVSITLTGDTSISVNLFNYFLISLDDYIQNHLNDGLVTITKSETALETLNYSYSSRYKCDPGTNTVITEPLNVPGTNKTNAQLYSINQSILSNKSSYTNYSPGPYIKDLFGLVPIKLPAKTGETYTEFGGTLQNQNRVYFGPVNIRKLTIQLLSDRGNFVDLNGADWTFSFICEQLYRS